MSSFNSVTAHSPFSLGLLLQYERNTDVAHYQCHYLFTVLFLTIIIQYIWNTQILFNVLFANYRIVTISKPSEESFSRDEIMITVAWLTLWYGYLSFHDIPCEFSWMRIGCMPCLWSLVRSFEQVYTTIKPSEESFSRDEIMITVAWLTLKIVRIDV